MIKKIKKFKHWLLGRFSGYRYGCPANKLIVIGVTGTAGKSATCYFIAQILQAAGMKVGMTTTTLFKIGDQEWLNDTKMTMLGRGQLQKILKQIVQKKCQVAIIETSSQGIEQYRHLGINYDILVFTNLYPEHIEAHGGFENYQQAKGKLFKYLSQTKHKKDIKKTIIVNGDDEYASYFLNFKADQKISFGFKKAADIKWNNLKTNILGEYNKYNILAGVAVAQVLGMNQNKIKTALQKLKPLPGRLEFIENDQEIKILIDYAFEPEALKKLYKITNQIEHHKIIHVLGSAGGGRDKARRPELGKIANEQANAVIITNEDPYDEDPQEIIDQVAAPVSKDKLYKIMDRREAIRKALQMAAPGDLVLITGKGAEQAICVANKKKIPWDDRQVVREELKKL